MEKLIEALRNLLQSNADMYSYAHASHWDVEGILYTQYHAFFKDIYEDVYDQIDPIAENIRKCGDYVQYPMITPQPVDTSPTTILLKMEMLNNAVISQAKHTFDIADALNEQGVANYCADRIDKHQFWAWWIKSSLKSSVV